jgi:hypothetical protein
MSTASDWRRVYGQGVPSAITRASAIAPRTTASSMILAFTGLSFLSTFEQPRPGMTKVYNSSRTTMSNVDKALDAPSVDGRNPPLSAVDVERALEPRNK